MNDYLSKPADPEALFAKLKKWLSLQSAPQAICPAVAPEFPSIKEVDTVDGLLRCSGNEKLYASLLLNLSHGQEEATRNLQSALQQGNADRFQFLCHSLKGEAGNLGLSQLSAHAARLEKWAHEKNLASCQGGMPALEESFRSVAKRVLQVLKPTPVLAQPATPSEALESLEILQTHLAKSDGDSLVALQPVLQRSVLWAKPGQLELLQQLVERFDFESALQVTRELSQQCAESQPAANGS